VKYDLRFGSRSTSQQHGDDGDEDISILENGNMKTKKGPKGGANQWQQRGGE